MQVAAALHHPKGCGAHTATHAVHLLRTLHWSLPLHAHLQVTKLRAGKLYADKRDCAVLFAGAVCCCPAASVTWRCCC
jgi:hypothetical protein